MSDKGKTYKAAGVNLENADVVADRIGQILPKTFRKGCVPLPGGFAGLFDLKKEGLGDCTLVMSTDGVGTKIKLGIDFKMYRGLGIDLVGMSVNDVLTLGAQPLAFLDYVACAKIDNNVLLELIEGIADGCQQSGCALMGGETAEMPGMYQPGDFDLAGFCIGAVAPGKAITGKTLQAGDSLIGLPSSGVHSNGYSLVRAVVSDAPKQEVEAQKAALIAPTKIYVKPILELCKKIDVRGMAHITGSGLAGNVTRIVPDGLIAEMRWGSWPVTPVFNWLQRHGSIEQAEMLRVFNMGVGFVVACAKRDEKVVLDHFKGEASVIGTLRPGAVMADDMRACVV